ncbi:putative folate/biopterin transporter [Leishmania infantum JPCM5]|uniref:Pteridine_transporter_(Truncated)_-_putative n=2 Tax=Leishmania infantum TaxID=5671 RepID=A0A6L0XFB4_LEIIN|nr:putative folate/biopterin transporter [Leishmania infantum JPCM5]CAC9483069.1 pteridine_transporter_(truncated)_-_putative [Leishmania infantum]CAM67293.1 putative folate/biopterin transporter [Leishmania infantum JPCM5]SUZ41193.1 pteridine_transporter_(truncated)_-_putative [Leishmania infantum]|eukprot:XP_001465050.1 putative folate/biopterin transporter [Leishmania infantum JPCM5]
MTLESHLEEADDNLHNRHADTQVLADVDNEYSDEYVHPGARRLYAKLPFMQHIPIFSEAATSYGPGCIGSLGICYLLCKGIANSIIGYAKQPLFMNRYGISGLRYQRLSSITSMGWSIKAFTAMLCDAFAAFGYTKRWYMFASCLLGGVFALILGLLPAKESSANTACAFIFLTAFSKANVDILSEGLYSRLMRRRPKAGAALVSWIWWFIMVGAIIAAAIQGPLSDSSMVQVGIFIAAGLQVVCALIFFFNLYEERTNRVERWEDALALEAEMRAELGMDVAAAQARLRAQMQLAHKSPCSTSTEVEPITMPMKDVAPHEGQRLEVSGALVTELADTAEQDDEDLQSLEAAARARVGEPITCLFGVFEVNRDVFGRNWRIFAYSVIMTCAVVAMTCGNILADTLGLLILCVIVSVVCCAASFWALPLVIAKANVFGYLQMVFYLQLPGALDSFYLADEECLPGGPHFSYTFYNTVSALIGNVGGLAGITVFNYIFSKHSYRLTLVVTTTVQILASVFDIIMVKRWNIAIGIPDRAMYIMGDAVVFQVCYYLTWMPVVILLSRLCPRGSESMVYALMAGFANLGETMATSIGSLIMEYAWGIVTTPPCDFSNVPMLLLVGHILAPILIIPLSLLLPAARVCDDINVDGEAVKREAKKYISHDDSDSSSAAGKH